MVDARREINNEGRLNFGALHKVKKRKTLICIQLSKLGSPLGEDMVFVGRIGQSVSEAFLALSPSG